MTLVYIDTRQIKTWQEREKELPPFSTLIAMQSEIEDLRARMVKQDKLLAQALEALKELRSANTDKAERITDAAIIAIEERLQK